jgi:hypothetical protein
MKFFTQHAAQVTQSHQRIFRQDALSKRRID